MHPAYSVIVFTTASGAGYGLLFWLSFAQLFGVLPESPWLALVSLLISVVLITTGLLASTLHLGHPERALGAFSQWRSSWLSREGIAAVATYLPAGLLALVWFTGSGSSAATVLALLCALGAAITVYCTGMIYASLRTIRQWHTPFVPLIYLALAAMTGALLFTALLSAFTSTPAWSIVLTQLCLLTAAVLKLVYWHRIDADPGQYTAEMATGLGKFGTVRPLDPPHTRPNFVMREMGYSVARRHALKLRLCAAVALFVFPAVLACLSLVSGWETALFLVAIIAATGGVFIERWLFFAEAEHVSLLYYGAQRR